MSTSKSRCYVLCGLAFVAMMAAGPAPAGLASPATRTAAAALVAPADSGVIRSRILGRDRPFFVSLPASHARTARKYPVIVVLDGEYNFESSSDIARRLASLGHIPEAIVVGVPNISSDPADRVHDLTPPGLSVSGSSLNEGGDRFLDFLEHELLPYVAEKYRGGAPAILVGWSSGGVLATWAAATRPGFGVVVSIDAPIFLSDQWLGRRLIDAARSELRRSRPLRYVTVQALSGWPAPLWAELVQAAPGNWLLRREVLEGESHESIGFLATYQGLKFAFQDYSVVGAPIPPRAPAARAFAHYERIEKEFGGELPPPAPVLDRLVFDLLVEGLVEPARRAVEWSVRGYGDTGALASANEMIARVQRQLPLRETVAQLLEASPPTPAEIAPYLGVWGGSDGPSAAAGNRLTVRFRLEDGKAVGETLESDSAGARLWKRVDYLKVLRDGVEFGRMNGMRPLGVWVWSARREGDALAGQGGFRGIVLPLPSGDMPPTIAFRLHKTG